MPSLEKAGKVTSSARNSLLKLDGTPGSPSMVASGNNTSTAVAASMTRECNFGMGNWDSSGCYRIHGTFDWGMMVPSSHNIACSKTTIPLRGSMRRKTRCWHPSGRQSRGNSLRRHRFGELVPDI